jgi:hypothetical protein
MFKWIDQVVQKMCANEWFSYFISVCANNRKQTQTWRNIVVRAAKIWKSAHKNVTLRWEFNIESDTVEAA